MATSSFSQPPDTKRRPSQRESRRRRAQDLIAPVLEKLPEQFKNTGNDSEPVARYNEVTRASVQDVVIGQHGVEIEDHGQRLAVIESRLGLRKPMGVARGLMLERRTA